MSDNDDIDPMKDSSQRIFHPSNSTKIRDLNSTLSDSRKLNVAPRD